MYFCLFCSQPASDIVDVQGAPVGYFLCPSCSGYLGMMMGHLGQSRWRIIGIEDAQNGLPTPSEARNQAVDESAMHADGIAAAREQKDPLANMGIWEGIEALLKGHKCTKECEACRSR